VEVIEIDEPVTSLAELPKGHLAAARAGPITMIMLRG
jgi:hypothetical protein